MKEMRAFVYNSNEEFELDGLVKPARDPVCGEVLKGEGVFFCMGDGRGDLEHSARRLISSFALKESDGGRLNITIDEFAELATFLHQLDDFVEQSGSSVGSYVTSYEKVNKLFAKNMFWHFMFAKGLLLKDTRFMERPHRTSFERVWQRADQSPDKLTYSVESMLFLPSKAAVTVKHQLPYVYSSDDPTRTRRSSRRYRRRWKAKLPWPFGPGSFTRWGRACSRSAWPRPFLPTPP